ncbi:MAG: hypothetical protein LLF89_09235 [Spirochaetaceae bacterium]|nr:hypothetical protein [Spirochaetaceae bacterium]
MESYTLWISSTGTVIVILTLDFSSFSSFFSEITLVSLKRNKATPTGQAV